MSDLKYLAAFTIPFAAILGLTIKGYFMFLTPIYAFVLIPILELIFPLDTNNLSANDVDKKLKLTLFDWLLYLNH